MARILTWKVRGDIAEITHIEVTLTDDVKGTVTRSHVPGQGHDGGKLDEPRDLAWWTPARLQACAEAERGLSKMDWHLDDQKGEIAMRSTR